MAMTNTVSIESVVDRLTAFQQRLSTVPLGLEESEDLISLFNNAVSFAIPDEDRAIILNLRNRVAQNPNVEDLNKVSKILMRYCPDEMIIRFLGLDTWQSEGEVAEAKQKIIQCFKKQDVELWLIYLGLSSLPIGIGQLSQLERLDCSGNKLNFLPESIGKLSQLERLNCSGNELNFLPESIGQLSKLKDLSCFDNILFFLPESIGQLSKLENLSCFDNNLISFPESIGQLSQLKYLVCFKNKFTSLPLILQLLVNARMNFSYNQISFLPPELNHLDIDISNQEDSQQATVQRNNTVAGFSPLGYPLASGLEGISEMDLTLFALGARPSLQLSDMFLNSYTGTLMNYNSYHGTHSGGLQDNIHINTNAQSNSSYLGTHSGGLQDNIHINNNAQSNSFNVLKKEVSDRRQDLKELEILTLKQDVHCWRTISLWLDKLRGTADFINNKTRPVCAERVLSILKLAEENEAYRKTLNVNLVDVLSTCSDRATLPLCSLEIQKAIFESNSGTVQQMLQVLKGAFASERVNVCAAEFMLSHPEVDEIEVYLGFQLKLKDIFHIPIGVEGMNFFVCSHIEDMDLATAMDRVEKGMQDKQALTQFLLEQSAWTEKLRKEFSDDREKALAGVMAKLDDLGEQLEEGKLTDQVYNDQSKALLTEFNSTEAAWLKAKTEEFCLNDGSSSPAAQADTCRQM